MFRRIFVSEEQVQRVDFGNPRQSSENEILDARLRRRSHRDRVAVAAQATAA